MFKKILLASGLGVSIAALLMMSIDVFPLIVQDIRVFLNSGKHGEPRDYEQMFRICWLVFCATIAMVSQLVCFVRLFKGPYVITHKNGFSYYPTRKLAIKAGYDDAERAAYVDNAIVRFGWLGIRKEVDLAATKNATTCGRN